ncbi:hypothetical protein MNEG_16052, partial [Monoraphidium neglectum]
GVCLEQGRVLPQRSRREGGVRQGSAEEVWLCPPRAHLRQGHGGALPAAPAMEGEPV